MPAVLIQPRTTWKSNKLGMVPEMAQPLVRCHHGLNAFTWGKQGFTGGDQTPPNPPGQQTQHWTSTSWPYSEKHCCSCKTFTTPPAHRQEQTPHSITEDFNCTPHKKVYARDGFAEPTTMTCLDWGWEVQPSRAWTGS